MKYFLGFLFSMILGTTCSAQSLSPVVQACIVKKKDSVCSGSFMVRNNQIIPLFVMIDKKMLIGVNGTPTTKDPDATVQFETSNTSIRLSPMASASIGYRLKCQSYPCAVQIVNTMVVGHTTDGVQIRLALPELVVACDAGKPQECRSNFHKAAGIPDAKK